MQTKSKDKQITGEHSETKETETLQDFHFAGGGEYAPITITAETYEKALEIWEKKKVKIKP